MEFRFYLDDIEIDEPIGWDSAKLNITRNLKNHGIVNSYVQDLEFVNSGFEYLVNKYLEFGVEAEVILKIDVRCNESYEFETIFEGKSNFASYERIYTDYCSVKLDFEEQNETLKITNNGDKEVNLNADHIVTLHPKVIQQNTRYYSNNIDIESFIPYNGSSFNGRIFYSVPFAYQENPIDAGLIAVTPYQSSINFYGSTSVLANFRYFASQENVKVTIQAKGSYYIDALSFDLSTSFDVGVGMAIRYGNNTTATNHVFDRIASFDLNTDTIQGDFDVNYELTIPTVDANDYICVCWYVDKDLDVVINPLDDNNSIVTFFKDQHNITIQNNIVGTETPCKTVKVFDAFETVSNFLLNDTNTFESNFFESGCGKDVALTTGFNIRQFDKPFPISFNSLINNLSPIYCLGFGFVNNKLRVEQLKYWYNTYEVVLNFSDIREIKETINNDLVFNTLEFGYQKNGTEEGSDKGNTLDGFNTLRKFNTPITQINNTFRFVSNYIADAYAIEFTRRQQYNTTPTNDWKFDNDIFILCLNQTDDTICEKDENFLEVNNCISPETQYNLRISPMRMALCQNQVFASSYTFTNKYATFTSGTKNTDLETKLDSSCSNNYEKQLLKENQDLLWNDENNSYNLPLFDPITISFTAPLSYSAYKTLKTKQNAKLTITKNGTIILNGFLLNVNCTINEGIADFTLLKQNANASEGCQVDYVEVDYVECDYVQ